MPGWDYSRNGYYFITPVIQYMKCILGKIENGEMILSDFGKIANDEWHKSFEIRKELILDEYIMMPNHLHAIIIIKNPDQSCSNDNENGNVKTHGRAPQSSQETHGRAPQSSQETHGRAPLHSPAHSPAHSPDHAPDNAPDQPQLYRQPKSLSSFMAGYKSATITKIDDFIDLHNLPIAKFNRGNKLWHSNYHDHIIRRDDEYRRIKNYIKNNPKNWNEDKFR